MAGENAAGMTAQGTGAVISMAPTVTAAQYAAGKGVGGIIAFANILPANLNGILESITLKFPGSLQTTQFVVCLFDTSPPNGSYADDTTPTWNASDSQYLIAAYPLAASQSPLGTQTIYNLDAIGKQINGASTSLYAVVITTSQMANTLAGTTDFQIKLGVVW